MSILLIAALFSVSSDGWYSVMVPEVSRADVNFLHSQGFDIEAVFGDRARVYVNDHGSAMPGTSGTPRRLWRSRSPWCRTLPSPR
jgi:hypothetical protein